MYWSFLSKTAAGIRDNGVANMVGSIFRTLAANELKEFEVSQSNSV